MEDNTSDDITTDATGDQLDASSSDAEPSKGGQANAGATDQPDRDAVDQGPIPFADHKRILEKARAEARALEDELAWAKGLDPAEVRQRFELVDFIQRNPRGAVEWLSQQSSFDGGEPPKPNLQTEDGRLLFDAEQAQRLVDYHVRRALATIDERLAPIEQKTQHEERAHMAAAMIEDATSWPYFDECLDEINELIEKAQRQRRPISLDAAYRMAVMPKLEQLTRKGVVNEIKRKSAASDRIRPGRTGGGAAPKDSDRPLAELIEEELTARK